MLIVTASIDARQNPFQPGPQGTPSGPARPPTTGTGMIAGRVIDATTGQGISGATVQMGGGARGALPVLTDSQGRFVFTLLPKGTFGLLAQAPGYVVLPAARRPDAVVLADGEKSLDVAIRLYRTAVVAGTVRDENGEPIVGANVIAFRRSGDASVRTWGARTDDRGEYRISGVVPGEIVLCACTHDDLPVDGVLLTTLASQPLQLMGLSARAVTMGADVATFDRSLRTFAPTFYPQASSQAQAARVTLAPGEARDGLNIMAPTVRFTRVSGVVSGSNTPVYANMLKLIPAADASAASPVTAVSPTVMQSDGRFDFAGVPPGNYILRAAVPVALSNFTTGPSGSITSLLGNRQLGVTTANGGPSGPPQSPMMSEVAISVGDEGVSGVRVPLALGPEIKGRVEFDPALPQRGIDQILKYTITLRQLSADGSVGGYAWAPVQPDRTFIGRGLTPGKYFIERSGTLASVTSHGIDVSDLAFDVGPSGIDDLVLMVAQPTVTELTGTVTGDHPRDLIAVAFPVDEKYRASLAASSLRFATMSISADGHFKAALPPGEYFVTTILEIESEDWMSAAAFQKLMPRATKVTVGKSGGTVEVKR